MLTKKLLPVFIFFFVSALFFSCKQEEIDQVDFDLQVNVKEGEYQCSWTKAN